MKLSKFWARSLRVASLLPFFYVLLFLLPYRNHLLLNICVVLGTLGGALELEHFFRKTGVPLTPYLFPILSSTLPMITYLEIIGLLSWRWTVGWLFFSLSVGLLQALFVLREDRLEIMLSKVSASIFVLIYPGLFFTFVVRLTGMEKASYVLLIFLCVMFGIDIFAYVVGVNWGRSSVLRLIASPNKSLAGFLAGFTASIGLILLFRFLLPEILVMSVAAGVLFGAALGILAAMGDLIESALKRSARMKDSGRIIPGRGGLLDSMDSWIICLPLFYFVLTAASM